MKNKILLLIVVVLSVIAISGSKKETTYFNNAKKEEVKEEIKLALKDTSTGEIKNIELEDYIVGVVAGEMPASFNEEALKAQAIAARTYAMYKMKNSNGTYDLVTDKTNQVYITEDKMKSLWQENFDYYFEKIKKAVYDTKDLIMTYNGDIILSLYFARSNGKTEDAIAVFGSNEEYLKSVESPEESLTSEVTISKDKFCNKLNISCDAINISNVLKSSSGRINSLNINGKTFKGTEIRTLFDLKSTDFDISIGSEIKFVTKGYGHGVGMSQYGANKLAQNGKNYEEIIHHFYTNVKIQDI